MSDEPARMTDEQMAAVRALQAELYAACAADDEAKESRQAQEHRFVERRVWEAEQRLLATVTPLLAHADALAAENARLRDVVSRAWDGYAAHGWFEFGRHDYQHEHPFCAECRAPVTFHYHEPNEHGGKSYLGYTCEHEAGCLVGQVEALLGGMQYVAPDAGGRR